MKEYNLKDNTVGTNLPMEYGTLNRLKNFLRLELTEKQEKVLTEVHNFWCREIEFSELKSFMYQEVDLSGVKDFWTQPVDFQGLKDFWCQPVDWSQELTFKKK